MFDHTSLDVTDDLPFDLGPPSGRPDSTALVPLLNALPSEHRRRVAETIGAAGHQPAQIAAVLHDHTRLDALTAKLPELAWRALHELAFANVRLRRSERSGLNGETAKALEHHGLAFGFHDDWSATYVVPEDLVAPVRRSLARQLAAEIRDVAPAHAPSAQPERLLHDVAVVGAEIGAGGVLVKADGSLHAAAIKRLAAVLSPSPVCDPTVSLRLELTMGLLREHGLVEVVGEGRPGQSARRELRLRRDIVDWLDQPPVERGGLLAARIEDRAQEQLAGPLFEALAGRTVLLHDLGSHLESLLHLAGFKGSGADPETLAIAMTDVYALHGRLAISWTEKRHATTVSFGATPPAEAVGGACVLGDRLELVTLRPLAPHEQAAACLLCAPAQRADRARELNQARVVAYARRHAERTPGSEPATFVLERLAMLARRVPAEVEQTIRRWIGSMGMPARLRSAIMLSVASGEEGDRAACALAPDLVAERLTPTLIAVPASRVGAAVGALRKAGIEVEPGMEAISGHWPAPSPAAEAHQAWAVSSPRIARMPSGVLASSLDAAHWPHRRITVFDPAVFEYPFYRVNDPDAIPF